MLSFNSLSITSWRGVAWLIDLCGIRNIQRIAHPRNSAKCLYQTKMLEGSEEMQVIPSSDFWPHQRIECKGVYPFQHNIGFSTSLQKEPGALDAAVVCGNWVKALAAH